MYMEDGQVRIQLFTLLEIQRSLAFFGKLENTVHRYLWTSIKFENCKILTICNISKYTAQFILEQQDYNSQIPLGILYSLLTVSDCIFK